MTPAPSRWDGGIIVFIADHVIVIVTVTGVRHAVAVSLVRHGEAPSRQLSSSA